MFALEFYRAIFGLSSWIATCISALYHHVLFPAFELFVEELVSMVDLLYRAVYWTICASGMLCLYCFYITWSVVRNTGQTIARVLVYPACSFVSRTVRAITNYFIWMTTVSANALVALAQMGWIWIKVRALKTYYFFKLPVARMFGLATAAVTSTWRLTKTLARSTWETGRYVLRTTKESCARAVRAAIAPVRALVASVKARYGLAKQMVRERYQMVKGWIGERWRTIKQMAGDIKARIVGKWRLMKQAMVERKRIAGERWRMTKQAVGDRWRLVKQTVGDRWRLVKQRWVIDGER